MTNIPLNEVVYFDAITHSPITGAVADADSAPTFEVFEEATDTDIGVGGSMTKRTDKIGNYRGTFTASAANGFEVGKYYSIVVSATVGEVAGKCVASSFRLTAAETTAGKIPATLGSTDYAGNTPQTGDAYSPAQHARTAAMAAQTAAEAVETIVKPDGPGDLAAIKTQTDKLSFTGTDVKATLDGEEVTPTTASKTGYALTSEERTAIAAAIEADLIDDETHQAVMAAILAKLEAGFPDLDTLTLTAIASQVRTELATELARIDAAISSRHAAGAAVAKSPATLNWSADVSNPPTIPAIADIRNTSLYTGAFTADVLANAPAGGEGGGGLTDEQAAQLAAILEDTGTSGVQVADKAGYSLSGSALSLGPTASRSKTDGYYKCPQGGTIGLYRRILGWDGDDLQQGDVSTITYSIFVLSSDDPQARTAVDGHEDVLLATSDVLYDSVQSDEWASNYNFKHIPDISTKTAFAKAGADYLVEYTITPTSGEKIVERVRVKAT